MGGVGSSLLDFFVVEVDGTMAIELAVGFYSLYCGRMMVWICSKVRHCLTVGDYHLVTRFLLLGPLISLHLPILLALLDDMTREVAATGSRRATLAGFSVEVRHAEVPPFLATVCSGIKAWEQEGSVECHPNVAPEPVDC